MTNRIAYMKKNMNIGLVLSGGGTRGVAHIGAIKAMEEHGIFPTHISGTSAGAVVGAFYAGGVELTEILDFFKTIPIFHAQKYARGKPGFIDTEKFYPDFKKLLPEDDFRALKKKLFITGTNVMEGTLKIFDSGEVIRPILASASFPGVFTPTRIGTSYYVDGGVLNNFPIEPLRLSCDRILGIYVNPLKKIGTKDLNSAYSVLERSYKIKMAADSIQKFKECDLVVHPEELSKYSTFNMKDMDVIFDIGYTRTKKILEESGFAMD